LTISQVLVEPAYSPLFGAYLGISIDRAAGKPVIMASAGGNTPIETIIRENPDTIVREYVDLLRGLLDYQARNLAIGINLPREHWRSFCTVAHNLFKCYVKSDAVLAEINPLIITQDNQLLALEGQMVIDENALFRHKDLSAIRHVNPETVSESLAREAGISYVKLDGQIGCMVNGAGLAMTTMDLTTQYGNGEIGPANFLDIGGGAKAEQVATGLRIILSDAHIKAVLINIFGGITRCDEVAHGILQAYREVKPTVPIVIRLQGTQAEEGLQVIESAGIPNLISAITLTDAAQKAIAAARGA